MLAALEGTVVTSLGARAGSGKATAPRASWQQWGGGEDPTLRPLTTTEATWQHVTLGIPMDAMIPGSRGIAGAACLVQAPGGIYGNDKACTLGPSEATGSVSRSCPTLRKITRNWEMSFQFLLGRCVPRPHERLHLDLTYFLLLIRVFCNSEGQTSTCRNL